VSDAFRLVALPAERFAPLFALSDTALRTQGARRVVVDSKPGAPCRVSLADAEVGETVLLLPFVHHDVETPYRGSGPIFVREGVGTAVPAVNEIPAMFRVRLLSVRAYDSSGMLLDAEVVQGTDLEATIRNLFADPAAQYLHIHNAGPGCFDCSVVRA
jgi:hypothetical protein